MPAPGAAISDDKRTTGIVITARDTLAGPVDRHLPGAGRTGDCEQLRTGVGHGSIFIKPASAEKPRIGKAVVITPPFVNVGICFNQRVCIIIVDGRHDFPRGPQRTILDFCKHSVQALVPAGPEGGEMGAMRRRLVGLGRGCVKDDEKRQSCRVGKGGLSCCRNECHGINNRASEDPRPARVDRAGGGIGEKIRHPMFLVQAPGSAGEVFG